MTTTSSSVNNNPTNNQDSMTLDQKIAATQARLAQLQQQQEQHQQQATDSADANPSVFTTATSVANNNMQQVANPMASDGVSSRASNGTGLSQLSIKWLVVVIFTRGTRQSYDHATADTAAAIPDAESATADPLHQHTSWAVHAYVDFGE
mmetsp:Transcript_44460/g.107584  ORF Transcript_44460/g.107584 Transcript_44460/m.107584 type:complete len:150 (+) Transcript_44460:709-1158(+)